MLRKILLSLSAMMLLALPADAQHERTGGGGGRGAPSGHAGGGGSGAVRAPQVFHGGPRGPVGWGDFHHDTAPARVTPHRFTGTNLPRPNSWRGNAGDFNLRNWQGGGWQHSSHGGRFGWWWVVGPDWYYYDEPVYPYPDLYTPFGQSLGWWYWCDASQEYYPYVTYCAVPWESVMPQE